MKTGYENMIINFYITDIKNYNSLVAINVPSNFCSVCRNLSVHQKFGSVYASRECKLKKDRQHFF